MNSEQIKRIENLYINTVESQIKFSTKYNNSTNEKERKFTLNWIEQMSADIKEMKKIDNLKIKLELISKEIKGNYDFAQECLKIREKK